MCIVKDTRKTLFLYPRLDIVLDDGTNNTGQKEEQTKVFDLIADLKIIATISNETIERILRNTGFDYIRCVPVINVEEMHHFPSISSDIERVRICVIGYDNNSYESAYKEICDNYINNKLKISHLVGLKISTSSESVVFSKPEGSAFDVVIETGLMHLTNVLVSIMLDISIFHYFSLSNDIEFRKMFSIAKMEYIKCSSFSSIYANGDELKSINYLPFSYKYINELRNCDTDEQKRIIKNLVDNYFDIVRRFVCKHISLTRYKELKDPYGCSSSINEEHLSVIRTLATNFITGKQYIVVIKDDIDSSKDVSMQDDDLFVFASDDDVVSKWLSKFSTPLDGFSLYYITIGD